MSLPHQHRQPYKHTHTTSKPPTSDRSTPPFSPACWAQASIPIVLMVLVLGCGLCWWSRHKEKAARETRIDELLIDTQDFNYLIHRLLTKGKVIPTPSYLLDRISPIFVFSRFLRVFTVSTRRFQRAASRNPAPRNSWHRCPTEATAACRTDATLPDHPTDRRGR